MHSLLWIFALLGHRFWSEKTGICSNLVIFAVLPTFVINLHNTLLYVINFSLLYVYKVSKCYYVSWVFVKANFNKCYN